MITIEQLYQKFFPNQPYSDNTLIPPIPLWDFLLILANQGYFVHSIFPKIPQYIPSKIYDRKKSGRNFLKMLTEPLQPELPSFEYVKRNRSKFTASGGRFSHPRLVKGDKQPRDNLDTWIVFRQNHYVITSYNAELQKFVGEDAGIPYLNIALGPRVFQPNKAGVEIKIHTNNDNLITLIQIKIKQLITQRHVNYSPGGSIITIDWNINVKPGLPARAIERRYNYKAINSMLLDQGQKILINYPLHPPDLLTD